MGKLGQLLVARGWITVQQLTRALQNQGVVGGRLGTCLIEMDALSEDNLLKALAEHLGVPAVNLDDLRGIPEEVLGLVPDKLARRCRAVPFRLEGSRLDLAMMDGRNLACQDEIAFATGKRVKVHVAHELRILEALEKYYKEECPSRYSLLADRLNRARYFWERPESKAESVTTLATPFEDLLGNRRRPGSMSPPPPLPDFMGLPDLPQRPRAATGAVPALPLILPPPSVRPHPVTQTLQAPPPPQRPQTAQAPQTPRMAAPVPALKPPPPATPVRPVTAAQVAPVAPTPVPAPPPAAEPPKTSAPRTRANSVPLTPEERAAFGVPPVTGPTPTTIEEVERALATAKDPDQVGRIVLAFLLRDHTHAALFQAGRDKITAWQAQGEGIDPKIFARYSVGFDQPSLFLNLREGSGVYLGPLPPMPAHRELARSWGGDLPRDCVMLPVRMKDRVVAVIYADGAKKVDLVLLQRLATATAVALGRCILLKKQGETKS